MVSARTAALVAAGRASDKWPAQGAANKDLPRAAESLAVAGAAAATWSRLTPRSRHPPQTAL